MTCEHFKITSSVFDDGSPASMWWCVACKLKFEPIKILKPLTNDEINLLWIDSTQVFGQDGQVARFARAIEAAHGIKEQQ